MLDIVYTLQTPASTEDSAKRVDCANIQDFVLTRKTTLYGLEHSQRVPFEEGKYPDENPRMSTKK